MFCPNCGNQIPDGSQFCSECGTKLGAAESAPQMQQPVNALPQRNMQSDQQSGIPAQKQLPVKTIVIVAVAAILLVFVGIMVLGGSDAKDAQPDDVTKSANAEMKDPAADNGGQTVDPVSGTAESGQKEEGSSGLTDGGQDAVSAESAGVRWMNAGAAENPGPLYDQLREDEKEIYDLMADHFEKGEYKRAELQKYPLEKATDKTSYQRASEAFSNDYPWVGNPKYYSFFNIRPKTTAKTEFSATFEDRRDFVSDREEIKEEVQRVAAGLSGTNSEKVCQINDYLKERVVYDEDHLAQFLSDLEQRGGTAVDLESTTQDVPHMAYGALILQASVCDGYAYAFASLCKEAGIPCYVIIGQVENNQREGIHHAWNTVQLEDGNWYEIDVTWNDAKENDPWFCVPTSEMEKDHMRKCAFQGVIPVTAGDSGDRSVAALEFDDVDWFINDAFDAEYPPADAAPVTDPGSLNGEWKMILKEDPANLTFLFEYHHVDLTLKVDGETASAAAKWYNGFTASVDTNAPFSTFYLGDQEPLDLEGTFDQDRMQLKLADEAHSGQKLQKIGSDGCIKTFVFRDFYEKDGILHGVGYVYDEEEKAVARVLIMKNR
ncbi:MAG: zinc-ribbon domain-containing protein [Lachnospiraceae bacterium]|nr:zinc-ribbon domain-containing protein [Lachnospiraceae bacterium]